jgi:hypothetical protein
MQYAAGAIRTAPLVVCGVDDPDREVASGALTEVLAYVQAVTVLPKQTRDGGEIEGADSSGCRHLRYFALESRRVPATGVHEVMRLLGVVRWPHALMYRFIDLRGVRCRADLPGAGDRTIGLLRRQGPRSRSVARAGARAARPRAARGIDRVWRANRRVYGARKVWRQLGREGIARGALHR